MKLKLFTTILLTTLLLLSCKKEKSVKTELTNTENQTTQISYDNEKLCFLYTLENSYKIKDKTVNQKDFIRVNLTINNGKAEGEYTITSNEETINIGHFSGAVKNNIVTTIHTYSKNKETFKDEFIFKIDQKQISILGGEKKLIDGVNMFVDKSKCDYMMQLPRVECN